jgi:hypothetical protein
VTEHVNQEVQQRVEVFATFEVVRVVTPNPEGSLAVRIEYKMPRKQVRADSDWELSEVLVGVVVRVRRV